MSAVLKPLEFDYKNPDYVSIFRERTVRLQRLRADAGLLREVWPYYRENIGQFISDWGVTLDQRVIARGWSAVMPFVLFPRQREWIDWVVGHWRAGTPAICDKSRDMGISWLAMSVSVSLCLFFDDMAIGFGSSKEENVDKSGEPKCLFYKGRMFLQYLPPEFRGGYDPKKHAPHMRISVPTTNSTISGEAGDNIGRGGRTGIYFVDEAAHLERPLLIDASLSMNTDCRIDMSSVNGNANSFAIRRWSGNIDVFTFHWRDDPRKDEAWYKKKSDELVDPIIVAQELDINYTASVEGIVIPAIWVQAARGAFRKLGIAASGMKRGALDVADQGIDKNAFAWRHGNELKSVTSWKGSADLDIYHSAELAFGLCDLNGLSGFDYDADGLGAGLRGDARKINEGRVKETPPRKRLLITPFRGSGGVYRPEQTMPGTERKHEDFFENYKAQAWWSLRFRFLATYRAVVLGQPYDVDDIISIAEDFPEVARTCIELSQPVYGLSKKGKLLIDKQPDGIASPNNADAVMMAFAPKRAKMVISDEILENAGHAR